MSSTPHPKSRGAARRATRRGPTIDDVAEVAGVSRGTVSRVLNGGHYVSPGALAAVESAMAETGYVVNSSARSLVTRRSGAVAVVLSEPQERLFEDPNFSVLVKTCSLRLAEADQSMVLMIAGNSGERERVTRYARAGHVDGALLISTHAGDPIFDALEAAGVPTVACGKPLEHEASIPFVAADDREGARQMVRYLRDAGRRRIATIAGPLDTSGGRDRLDGYRDVLGEDAGEELVVAARHTHRVRARRRWTCCSAGRPTSTPSSSPPICWRRAPLRRCGARGGASPRTSRWAASTTRRSRRRRRRR